MPNGDPPYSVDYYQVNAGTGDCEILLLLNNNKPLKERIEKAVLIDGGQPTAYFLMNIRKTFDAIEAAYTLEPQKLEFDAVIITHWDEDHYRGVLELMSQDLDKLTGQVSWLKYTGDQPTSFLYIPYRFRPSRGNFTYEEVSNDLFLCLEVEKSKKRLCKVVSDSKETPLTLPSTPKPFDPTTSELIGRELFNNFYRKQSVGEADSPKALVDIYSGDLDNRPGLFCVGANYQYLKPSVVEGFRRVQSVRRPQSNSIDRKLVGRLTFRARLPRPNYRQELHKDTRKSSIVCLVIWPDEQITHYLAGDAPLALEEAVVKWTGLRADPDEKRIIQVVKASNHGARTSFPSALCQNFKPSYILCSVGKGLEYPNWEFMFKLYSSTATIWEMNKCQIFFTNFPYYLRGDGMTFEVEETSLCEGSDLYKSLSPALKKYEKGMDPKAWVRSALAQVVLPRFAWFNDDFYPKEAADARDDIQFILIQSPTPGRQWSATAGRLTSKRRATDTGLPQKPSRADIPPSSGSENTSDDSDSDDSQETPNVFYITSSSTTKIPSGEKHGEADTKWKAFIGALSPDYLILSEAPGQTSTSLKLRCDVEDVESSDRWLSWLINLLNATVDLSVVASLKENKTVEIDHFELLMTIYFQKSIKFTFRPGEIVGPRSAIIPFDPYKHFLHFGLEKSTPSIKITLNDLISFYRFSRKTLWFDPDLPFDLSIDDCDVWLGAALGCYSGTFRLQASIQTIDLSKFLEGLEKMALWDESLVPKVTVVVKRNMTRLESGDGDLPTVVSQLGFALEFENFSVIIFCSSASYLVAFRWPTGAIEALEEILTKAGCQSSFKDTLDKIAKSFDILGASVEIKEGSIARVTVDVELTFCLHHGNELDSNDLEGVSFLLTFAYPQFLFRASLITTEGAVPEWRKKMPDYEPLLEVAPKRTPSRNLSISDLIPDLEKSDIPHGIPDEVTQATFQLDGSIITFSGTLKSGSTLADDSQIPAISFATLELDASYSWALSSWSLSIAVTVQLSTEATGNNTDKKDGILYASVDYDSGSKEWVLTGGLSNITFHDLLMFFDEDERSQVHDMLGSFNIPSVFLTCKYGGGKPSEFHFEGTLAIGKNELQLLYSRDHHGWEIAANLTTHEEYTLINLLIDMCGGPIKEELPPFFEEINLVPSTMSFKCTKNEEGSLIASLNVTHDLDQIGNMKFTLVQISYKTLAAKKSLLSLELTNLLPSLKINAPLFGPLNNPIDGLELIWINKPEEHGNASGLTKKELGEIADSLGIPIHFKQTKVSPDENDVLITAGCHFMLLLNDCGKTQVALDYAFAAKGKEAVSTGSSFRAPPSPPSQSKAVVNKTVGPLSVTNIGLQYEGGRLLVVLDASLSLGPVSLSLLGFGLGVKLDSNLFKKPDLNVELEGLAAGLDKAPLSLDGLFKVVKTNPDDAIYSGGVVISVMPYGILAFGSYGKLNNTTTFFIFGQLEGPLVELGFATIDGVKLGFGYNSHLAYPTVDNVVTFPLVQGINQGTVKTAEESSNVLTILKSFDKWLQPQQNSLWFAAGLEVTAFKSLHVNAVAVVEVDPDISLALFAKVDFSFPPKGIRSFAYAELGIACRLIFKEGLFTAEASLSPRSYVLDPSCHLSGGMALCYWFDPSPYAGDFVFSIGGYHKAFNAPPYYPKPQRLGIAWRLDDRIHIEGNAYFAITPKACMGGGNLDLRFSAGPVYAYFTAYADFFIVYSPFYFMADMGVSIGGNLRWKVLWWNIDIPIHVGADLHIEGPPFSGTAWIDISVTNIEIHFGDAAGAPGPLTLVEFWDLLSSDDKRGSDAGITLGIESGSLPGENDKVETDSNNPSWAVKPHGFSFIVQCRFALQEVLYGDLKVISDTGGAKYNVYSKLMHSTTSLISNLTIMVTRTDDEGQEVKFTCKPIWKNVPSAQWGLYTKSDDPSNGKAPSCLLDGTNSTTKMLMGVHLIGPAPELSEDGIAAYNVMSEDIISPRPRLPQELKAHSESFTETMEQAKTAWTEAKEVQVSTTQWKDMFHWKTNLIGKQPEHLLNKLESFYLYAPKSTTQP